MNIHIRLPPGFYFEHTLMPVVVQEIKVVSDDEQREARKELAKFLRFVADTIEEGK